MIVSVSTNGTNIHNHFREKILKRCNLAFSRISDKIQEVRVSLTDNNGPKGGEDKECIVQLRIEKQPPIVIKKKAERLGRALGLAILAAKHNVRKSVSKHKLERRRHSYVTS